MVPNVLMTVKRTPTWAGVKRSNRLARGPALKQPAKRNVRRLKKTVREKWPPLVWPKMARRRRKKEEPVRERLVKSRLVMVRLMSAERGEGERERESEREREGRGEAG